MRTHPPTCRYYGGKKHAQDTSFDVTPEQSQWLKRCIDRDAAWLADRGLMDYSVILGVRVLPLHEAVAEGLVVRDGEDATPVIVHVPGTTPDWGGGGADRAKRTKGGGHHGSEALVARPAVTVGRPFACVVNSNGGDDQGEVHVYYAGIIDFLQEWGFTKTLAKNIKVPTLVVC